MIVCPGADICPLHRLHEHTACSSRSNDVIAPACSPLLLSCRSYYFTDKHKLLADVRSNRFLEAARVAVHCRPETSSAAAAAVAPKKPLSYWYGTSLATVREVAATGKLCVMSLDMQGAEVSPMPQTVSAPM